MATVFDYIFNLSGNYQANVKGFTAATGEFKAKVESTQSAIGKLVKSLTSCEIIFSSFSHVTSGIQALSASFVKLDQNMHDLSAIGGVVGEDLKKIERYARESAKAFGTDVSDAVTGYKLLLSQLSPELAKSPEALKAMGESIQTTSKLMGGDGVAAAEVLTTAMNQYGVSLEDPIAASKEMARMMNVMAAAGQAGSAELPAIKVALEQCGMAAKAAGVSFEETNAAIQVLDKAGKKGAEGGVALRNVMSTLAKGRFLPKVTQEELRAANIDVNTLTDTSKSLHDRLETLRPVMEDQALLTKLFGQANANAAMALIGGTEALSDFTAAVTGTSSAEDQAQTIMESYAERQARVNAVMEDFKISLTQMLGDLPLWADALSKVLVPLAQILPLLGLIWKGMVLVGTAFIWVKTLRMKAVIYGIQMQIAFLRRDLGLFRTRAVAAFGTFRTAAVASCRAVGTAIRSIPIIGWIAIVIGLVTALGVYLWNTSATFRAVLKGCWAVIKEFVANVKNLFLNVFGGIGKLLLGIFTFDWEKVKEGVSQIGSSVSDTFGKSRDAFRTAYDAEMKASAKAPAETKKAPGHTSASVPTIVGDGTADTGNPTDVTSGSLSGTGTKATSSAGASGSGKITHVTVNLQKLIEHFEVNTTMLQESSERVRDVITQTLLDALADTAVAVG